MTPEELARLHPQLYHVTSPLAWPSISRHGLRSTANLLELFEVSAATRVQLTTRRRASEVSVTHPVHGLATIQDNKPLSEAALDRCLDDGLRAADWLAQLNQRVFFWADRAGLDRLLAAQANRRRPRAVLVFDTLRLVQAQLAHVEVSPINSGSTIRRPARRGLRTFTPLPMLRYAEWRRRRGQFDRVLEITVRDAVPDVADYLVDRWISHAAPRD